MANHRTLLISTLVLIYFNFLQCAERSCPPLQIPDRMFATCSGGPTESGTVCSCGEGVIKPGTSCSFTCDLGAVMDGPATLTCGEDYQWNHPLSACVGLCRRLEVPEHGSYEGKCNGMIKPKETCTFDCSPGFVLKGLKVLTCSSNLQWSNDPPKCVNACPAVSVAGAESLKGNCNGSAKAGEKCTVSCPKDYVLFGDKDLVCHEDFDWDKPFPTCERVCPALKAPEYGSYEGKCKDARVYESCIFGCKPGFVLKGAKALACSSNFRWTDDPPKCVDSCQPINNWEFSTVEGDCRGKIRINQTCRFFCPYYEKLVGNKEITCGENFTWSGTIPKCESTECNKAEPNTTNTWNSHCWALNRECTEPLEGHVLTECGPCRSGFKEDPALAGEPDKACIAMTGCEKVESGTTTWAQHCSSLNRVCNETELPRSTAQCGQCLDNYVEDQTQTGSSDRACAAPALKRCMMPFYPSQPEGPTWTQHCAEQNKECNSVIGLSCDDCLRGYKPGRRLTDPCVSGAAAIVSWFLTVVLVSGLATILNRL